MEMSDDKWVSYRDASLKQSKKRKDELDDG